MFAHLLHCCCRSHKFECIWNFQNAIGCLLILHVNNIEKGIFSRTLKTIVNLRIIIDNPCSKHSLHSSNTSLFKSTQFVDKWQFKHWIEKKIWGFFTGCNPILWEFTCTYSIIAYEHAYSYTKIRSMVYW